VQLSSGKATAENAVLDLSGKLKVIWALLGDLYQYNVPPQALEEQMHSILQHQAKVAADQAHALNQALDSRTQELLKAQASLTEVSQRHHTLQSQYTSPAPFNPFNYAFCFSACHYLRLN
jgi:hypothetical protein